METKETSISDDMLNQAVEGADNQEADDKKTAELEATTEAETEKAHKKSEETVSETKEAKQEEVKKEGESEQQFRSRLGKRVSRMEDNMSAFMNEMRLTMQNLQSAPHVNSNPVEEGEPSYISTENDVRQIIQKMENERLNATKNYTNNYFDRLAKLGLEEGLDDNEFTRLEELVKNAPITYKDASLDAEHNFLKAMRVIDKERNSKEVKKANLKGDTPLGTGTVSGTKIIDNHEAPIKLDKYAQEFVDYHKLPENKVKNALKSA